MGAGIYARRDLAPGELLWEESPVIETDAPMTDSAARAIRAQYGALPADHKAEVGRLYDRKRPRKRDAPPEVDILSIFDTNSTEWNAAAALCGPGDEGGGDVPSPPTPPDRRPPRRGFLHPVAAHALCPCLLALPCLPSSLSLSLALARASLLKAFSLSFLLLRS